MNTRKWMCVILVMAGLAVTAQAQTTYTWANSNVTGTPVANLDWFGASKGTWIAADPMSNNGNTIQFFENITTALPNTATPSTQTVNLNNSGTAFQLGTLTLSGRASGTVNANLTMNLLGDALNFSASTGTVNLDSVSNTRTITYNVTNNIQLGTSSSASILTLTGNGSLGPGNVSAFNFSGSVSELQAGGGSKLIKSGTSTATISGAVTVSGGLEVNGGTLALANASNAITGGITLNGGGLSFKASSTIDNRNISVSGASRLEVSDSSNPSTTATITLNSGSNLTLGSNGGSMTISTPVSGDGAISINRVGSNGHTQVLSSTANTFKGTVSFTGGATLSLTVNSLADSASLGAGNIRFAVGAGTSAQTFALGSGAIAPLILNNRRIELVVGSAAAYTIANNSSQVLTINTDLLVGVNTGSPVLTLGGTGAGLSSFNGKIENGSAPSLGLIKSGTGTWVLGNNANSYTGTTQISDGRLVINSIDALGAGSSAIILGNIGTSGTLEYTGAEVSTSRTFRIGSNNDATGAGAILNNGTGTLTFTNATFNETYAITHTTQRTLTLGGTNDGVILGAIQRSGPNLRESIAKVGSGTWTLGGTNTYAANTDVNGGTLRLQSGATTITQTLGALRNQLAEGTLISNKSGAGDLTTTFSSYARAAGATGNIVSTGGINGADNSVNITGTAGFIDKGLYFGGSEFAARNALNGYVRALAYGSDATTVATNTITANNHVKLTTTSYSGAGVTLLTLNLQGGGINWTNTSGTLTAPGILKSGGGSSTISGGNVSGGSNVELVIRTDTASDSLAISSILSQGSGVLTKSGAGTLTLSGNNTYTGQTHINAGTLSISANNNLGAVATGATLNLKSGTLHATSTFGLFNGTAGTNNRSVTLLDQSTIEVTGTNTLTIAGVISNNGSAGAIAPGFNKTGTGTLILSGANTYTGETIINGGKLALGGHNVLPNKLITLISGTFDAGTYTNTLSTLKVTGSGTIVMSPGAALAFADSSAISWNGTLNLSGVFAAGTSLRFGTSSAGLTPAQLSALTVTGYKLSIDANGYITGRPSGTLIFMK